MQGYSAKHPGCLLAAWANLLALLMKLSRQCLSAGVLSVWWQARLDWQHEAEVAHKRFMSPDSTAHGLSGRHRGMLDSTACCSPAAPSSTLGAADPCCSAEADAAEGGSAMFVGSSASHAKLLPHGH